VTVVTVSLITAGDSEVLWLYPVFGIFQGIRIHK
jgi:hypothetical protein